jgi:hypothetical protein
LRFKSNLSKTLSQNNPTQKRAGGVAQVVDHLPSKCETLSSNPSNTRKKGGRKERRKRGRKEGRKEERKKERSNIITHQGKGYPLTIWHWNIFLPVEINK